MTRSRFKRSRTAAERKFNRWLGAWVIASIILFLINLVNSPQLLWSVPFIFLWTLFIGIYALKSDRKRRESGWGLLEGTNDQQVELQDLGQPEVQRRWKESDFV